MRKLPLLSILVFSFGLQAQESTSGHHEEPRVDKVDRVCGRLVESEGETKGNTEKTRSLARISVDLYKADDSSNAAKDYPNWQAPAQD